MKWTKSSIEARTTAEVQQLRLNAEKRGNAEIVAMCDEVLASRPKTSPGRMSKPPKIPGERPLVSRGRAFAMRGVKLRNSRWSWGGIRDSDGMVVFTLWADSIERIGDTCRYMLWGPNRGGDRPWADKPGGKERLRQCQVACAMDEAEGFRIYGERRGDDLPIDQASRVSGAEPTEVLRFRVVLEGDEYWAVWTTKAANASAGC